MQDTDKCCYLCKCFKRLLCEDWLSGPQGYCCKGKEKSKVTIDGNYPGGETCKIVYGIKDLCDDFVEEEKGSIGRYPDYPKTIS